MKKILIALDYDPTAQKVAEVGYQLGKAMNAEIILLHVITYPAYYTSSVYNPIMGFGGYINYAFMEEQGLIDETKKATYDYLEKTKKHLNDDNIKLMTKEGTIDEAIIYAAKEIDANIIVLGSHSRRWLESILIGSVAEKVLHHSSIPIFIIPTKNR